MWSDGAGEVRFWPGKGRLCALDVPVGMVEWRWRYGQGAQRVADRVGGITSY
jgi:hypothetical protein